MELATQKNLIQRKIIISFALIGAALVAGCFVILLLSIDSTFKKLEAEQSLKDISDAERAIERQIETLSAFNRDYAAWDETYEAMANRSSLRRYLERNLSLEQWPELGLGTDGMLLFDTDGVFVGGTLLEYTHEQELSTKSIVLDELEAQYDGFTKGISESDLPDEVTGFINTSQGLLLIVSGPIRNSDAQGESRGRFLAVRFLNSERLAAMGRRARVELNLIPDATKAADDPASAFNSNYVVQHFPIRDPLGTTLALVEVRTPRDISLAGAKSVQNAMWFLSLAIIAAIILAWLALRRLMVQPLLSLKTHVADMRETGDLASRYNARVQDEVGALGDEIDFLAVKLDTSHTQLTLARDKAESTSRVKSEFLSTMSHELRTPLNGVIGMTDLLLNTKLAEKQQHLAKTAMSSAHMLLKLINDILDFSQISSVDAKPENSQFSMNQMLREVNTLISDAAQNKGIDYQVSVDDNVPDTLVADGLRLKQVLLNLLDNAVKFTESGSVGLSIDCPELGKAWAEDSLKLEFTVSDTGVGIRSEDQGTIFELFSQADNSSTRAFGGVGLGLSISKDLVEMMGGEIVVSSVYGQGSEFFFTIPAKVVSLSGSDAAA